MINSELTIILPTYNESENIPVLFTRLQKLLHNHSYHVLVVDDNSPDGTADIVNKLSAQSSDISCIKRIHERGLSSACIAGFNHTNSPYIAVMDADLQHDEQLLPAMLEHLKMSSDELVIGSRYVNQGSLGSWSLRRRIVSKIATSLGQLIVKGTLNDPMSGFFMMNKELYTRSKPHLNGKGFKILLDLIASSPTTVKFKELPYTFRTRQAGESKLSNQVIVEYIELIFDKLSKQILGKQ